MDTSAVNQHTTEAATGEADSSGRTHVVFFTTGERSWFFYNVYRGVTPTDARRAALRDFVHDRHVRLVAHAATSARPPRELVG
jgi:hypothetical protein